MIGSTGVLHSYDQGGPAGIASPNALVSAGSLASGVTFARASSGLLLGTDGASWQSAAADAPRFQGASRRLLLEGARTNSNPNSRFEGAQNGSGNYGTGWTAFDPATPTAGLSRTCLGNTTMFGLPGVLVQIAGTTTAAAVMGFQLNAPINANPGDLWTTSIHGAMASSSGAAGQASLSTYIRPKDASFADTQGGILRSVPVALAVGALARAIHSSPALAAGTNRFQSGFSISYPAGVTVNDTVFLACHQPELGAFASSPVLSPAGTIAASTRAADVAGFALSGAAAAQGTLVGTFLLPQAAPAGADQGLLTLDDGTAGNRIGLRNAAGGLAIVPVRAASGVETVGGTAGTVSAGTSFKAALAWDAGGIVACVAGGAVQSLPGAPPALTRILFGQGRGDLASLLFGEIGPLNLHSTRLADSSLQALTSG
ncbi:hypothetical protein [Roseomonas populi]|uniref:Uncharacterized protein n=1 Tax=Roseomonas populi TaxID=3121582 RepID=A0ABT1X4D9_9PROT|nr:hypothetical protein [Roseomonas pecuniae]MCR0981829.1 hypothetical protein [Roseomonas pecuniae]